MNFVRYLASRCSALLNPRSNVKPLISEAQLIERIRYRKRAGYIECLRAIGESPLDQIAIGESERSVYRLALLKGKRSGILEKMID
jgi:hypothetical protein